MTQGAHRAKANTEAFEAPLTQTLVAIEAPLCLLVFPWGAAGNGPVGICSAAATTADPAGDPLANNLGLFVIDTLALRLSFPVPAVGLAVIAQDRGW